MKASIKSKLVLTFITTVLLAGAIAVPLSSSILHSHAASSSSQASWSVVPSPNVDSTIANFNVILGMAPVSSNDIWAVGRSTWDNISQALIEHWNGTSWSIVQSSNTGIGSYLDSV